MGTDFIAVGKITRTDIHRPSALNPREYEFVGMHSERVADIEQSHALLQARRAFESHMQCHPGAHFSRHEHGGVCHVCGNANAMTLAIFYHSETNVYIRVGEDCAAKIGWDCDSAFRAIRSEADALARARSGKLLAKAKLAEAGLSSAWDVYAATERADFRFEESTITDIVSKLVRYGSISTAQETFLRKLLDQITDRAKADADRAAKAALSQHIGEVGKRETLDLTIRLVRSWETQFGITFLHVFDSAQGTVVYKGSMSLGARGDKIRVAATIAEHTERTGEKQTVIKRPKVVTVRQS